MFSVYVLENDKAEFYVGHTEDLERRVHEHNSVDPAGKRYTAKHGPWTLVWNETFATRAEAIQREREIKSMKSSRWIRERLLGNTRN